MFEVAGKFGTAKVYIEDETLLEESAREQIRALMDNEYVAGSTVRIMPDCHAGKGCVIGFTQTLPNRTVIPSLVGCDIGCGMSAIRITDFEFDKRNLGKLDSICHHDVPSGFDLHKTPRPVTDAHPNSLTGINMKSELAKIIAPIDIDKALRSIGTLGSGNHFIELNEAENGDHWLVVHTGSRHLGLEIEGHYTTIASQNANGVLTGKDFDNYIHDMAIAQKFASMNRGEILKIISDAFKWSAKNVIDYIETIHNYIDIENMIVRKGAIRLEENECAIIPMNMADGSLIVRGHGNVDWNMSGPHGAGRLMSRGAARRTLKMEDFRASMDGIYTTTVCEDTIDESKMAYKPMESIVAAIKDTCDIVEIVKPVYNFKAAEKRRR